MAKVEVTMPKMGESITEGTVIEWHKQPGDSIELDEPLLEIGTDKVDTEVPAPAAGTLAEILIEAGEVVDVGTVIALIETEAGAETDASPTDDGPDQADQSDHDTNEASPADETSDQEKPAEATRSGSGGGGSTIDVVMPKMGESIVEGTILSWAKGEGDSIDLDETLLEIATDKVDTEVPSPAAGTVLEILVPEGETVDVGTRIAVISSDKSTPASASKPATPSGNGASDERPSTPAPAAPAPAGGSNGEASSSRYLPDGRFLSPLVRSIATTEGVTTDELASIQGSGHDGRISKKDILGYLKNRGSGRQQLTVSQGAQDAARPARNLLSADLKMPAKAPGDRVEVVPMDRMRQMISEHMIRSVTTSAHVTSFAEIDVTRLVRLREKNKDEFLEREGVKLTYTPFFVYAAVEALREHPILNASVDGTDVLFKKDYHIGIAVAIGKTGLVVPVIRDAGQKNIVGLAQAAADLATRTRSKQLLPDQLQGGTFTVTNVGSLGSIMGTPIINQPQLGILATGAIKKRPVVIEDPVLGDTIGIRSMMIVSLSYDHRVVDGAMGSSFLAKFRDVLESLNPNEEI